MTSSEFSVEGTASVKDEMGGWKLVPVAALKWLNGEGPDDNGRWFGEDAEAVTTGRYWWRKVFNRMLAAAPSRDQVTMGALRDIETQAWECDKWPVWLHNIVDRTNDVADRLDMSAEQAIAYAVLASLSHPSSLVPTAEQGEPAHKAFRRKAMLLAMEMDGADFVAELEPPTEDTPEALARTLAIVAAAYEWNVADDGYLYGLVAGDQGYTNSGIKAFVSSSLTPPIAGAGEEPVAWRIPVNDDGRLMNIYTEQLPYNPPDHVKVRGEVEPLYSAASISQLYSRIGEIQRERDEARAEARTAWGSRQLWHDEAKGGGK